MSFDLAGVASVFGNDESAVRWSYELLCKVVMFTFEISLPSVKPAPDQTTRSPDRSDDPDPFHAEVLSYPPSGTVPSLH